MFVLQERAELRPNRGHQLEGRAVRLTRLREQQLDHSDGRRPGAHGERERRLQAVSDRGCSTREVRVGGQYFDPRGLAALPDPAGQALSEGEVKLARHVFERRPRLRGVVPKAHGVQVPTVEPRYPQRGECRPRPMQHQENGAGGHQSGNGHARDRIRRRADESCDARRNGDE